MEKFLHIVLYTDVIIMLLAILVQARGTGLSATFGGEGGVFRERRGIEKVLHVISVITVNIFLGVAFILPFQDKIFS